MCKALGSHLAEFEEKVELKQMSKFLLAQAADKGKEFWLGGLNPGLLWIWSNSARPINANTNITLAAASAPEVKGKTPDGSVVQKVKREDNDNTSSEKDSSNKSTKPTYDEIKGNGRCLRWSFNAKKDRYQYTGHDCSARLFYLCEFEDKSNEIDRMSKLLREVSP